MDPISLGLGIGSIASPIIGGLMGQNAAQSQQDAANAARQQALAQYAGINIPDVAQQQLALQQLQSQGRLTPQMEQAMQMGPSQYGNIAASQDPRLQQAQMASLAQMQGVASTGMTPADQAAFEQVRRSAAQQDQAKQGQIMQEMQSRGQGGSGAELIAKLKGAQVEADTNQQGALQQAQMQQQARMQAMQQAAGMAGTVRGQNYTQASDAARAQDIINQFNTQNAQNVGNANVGMSNQAQASNLQNAQNIANQNAQIANQQQQYNKGLYQQQYQNQMQMAGAKASQLSGVAQAAQQQAANTAGYYGQMGQGAGQAFAGAAKAYGANGTTTKPDGTTTNNYYGSSGAKGTADNSAGDFGG